MPRWRGGGGFGRSGGRGLGGGYGMGPIGECICPNCGYKQPHKRSIPCYSIKCPRCGKLMTRVY
jgi:electron transport complex protein RnfB